MRYTHTRTRTHIRKNVVRTSGLDYQACVANIAYTLYLIFIIISFVSFLAAHVVVIVVVVAGAAVGPKQNKF